MQMYYLCMLKRKNEAVGPDATVYNALNLIRHRVSMPDLATGLTVEQMRKEIRHEMRIELAEEGLYYYDVLRWKTAAQVLNANIKCQWPTG